MKHKLQRAGSLSLRDWGILAEAWLTLSWIDFVVSYLPYQWWTSWLSPTIDNSTSALSHATDGTSRISWLVDVAANNHPRKPTCLRRSLCLKRMLKRRGINTLLCFGVSKEGQQINAHAWVECKDGVINDSADIATRYSQFPTLTKELVDSILR